MSRLAKTFTGRSVGPMPGLVPASPEMSSTYLTPADPFPAGLAEVELLDLQVLHSGITRQLDREYLDPDGPHPVTVDRAQELAAELDIRQEFLAPARPASPAEPRAGTTGASRGAGRPGEAPPPTSVRKDRAVTARVEDPTASAPGHDEEHAGDPARTRDNIKSDQIAGAAGTPVRDLDRLRPGHRIQVWHCGQMQCVGTVEEAAPSLGVLWIREAVDGYRRMVHTQDTELRYHPPGAAR